MSAVSIIRCTVSLSIVFISCILFMASLSSYKFYLARKYHIEIQEHEVTDAERQEMNERQGMMEANDFAMRQRNVRPPKATTFPEMVKTGYMTLDLKRS